MPSDRQTEIQARVEKAGAFADGDIEWLLAELSRVQQERDEALAVLAPNMPGSGLVDACRQVKQVAISEAGNSSDWMTRAEKAEAERDALTQEIATLRQQIGDLADMFSEWAQHMRQVREGLRPTDHDMKMFYDSVIVGADRASSRVRAIIQKGQ